MKKRPSLQRQLSLYLILPLLVVLVGFSVLSYFRNLSNLKENQERQKDLIVHEIKNLTSFYDEALTLHEGAFTARMEKVAAHLKEIFPDTDPCSVNLVELEKKAGMDTATEFTYVLNDNTVICNTTFAKDLGLDFKKISPKFVEFFTKIKNEGVFRCDRFGVEIATGKIKKWGYLPLKQKGYLLEMGFDSKQANQLKNSLADKAKEISVQHSEFRKVILEPCITNIKSLAIDSVYYNYYNKALKEKTTVQMTEEKEGSLITNDFVYIEMKGATLYDGYILQISSDDRQEKILLKEQLIKNLIILFAVIVPLVVLMYIGSRRIIRPVKNLTKKTQIISSGNLNERTEVEGSKEFAELSENFNTMVEKLSESYEGLEQKVKDRTAEVVQQKHIIEEKSKEIIDSIQYAKRIQRALLASDNLLASYFEKFFLVYMPKDIVSGDFFWATPVNEDKIIVIIADCTGHGVPGAFMSLLNISKLNETVNERKIHRPDLILNNVRKELIQALNPGGTEDVNDGMDCILFSYDKKLKQIEFAAANNPVWLYEKTDDDFVLKEFTADKMAVGKNPRDQEPFTLHTIQIQHPSLFTAFTDGYADQFGGEKGKKFKYKQLNELLKSNAELPVAEQKKILEDRFIAWRGDLEQIDDVCLIGIKFD